MHPAARQALEELRRRHHELAKRVARGETPPVDMAYRVGVLLQDPAFRELVEYYRRREAA